MHRAVATTLPAEHRRGQVVDRDRHHKSYGGDTVVGEGRVVDCKKANTADYMCRVR
jgi:hypothetical protein